MYRPSPCMLIALVMHRTIAVLMAKASGSLIALFLWSMTGRTQERVLPLMVTRVLTIAVPLPTYMQGAIVPSGWGYSTFSHVASGSAFSTSAHAHAHER